MKNNHPAEGIEYNYMNHRRAFLETCARTAAAGLALPRVGVADSASYISRSADGKQRRGRYTDNWARRDGTWVAVSAHYNLDRDG